MGNLLKNWLRKLTYKFSVHSNDRAHRKVDILDWTPSSNISSLHRSRYFVVASLLLVLFKLLGWAANMWGFLPNTFSKGLVKSGNSEFHNILSWWLLMTCYRIASSRGVVFGVVVAAVFRTVLLFLSPLVESSSWSSLTGWSVSNRFACFMDDTVLSGLPPLRN